MFELVAFEKLDAVNFPYEEAEQTSKECQDLQHDFIEAAKAKRYDQLQVEDSDAKEAAKCKKLTNQAQVDLYGSKDLRKYRLWFASFFEGWHLG